MGKLSRLSMLSGHRSGSRKCTGVAGGSAFESPLHSGNLSKLVCDRSCHSSIEQQSSNSIAAEIIFKKF